MNRLLLLGLTAWFWGSGSATTATGGSLSKPVPMQTAQSFSVSRTQTVSADYLLYLPKGYASEATRRWPLILFLHGAGERGSDLSKVAVHGPPKVAPTMADFPFIVVSPQCPEGQVWSQEVLLGLLDHVMKTCRVDSERVYLTGLSMGGYGTWDLGISYPEKFAAIVPICGGGETIKVLLAPQTKADALRSLPVRAYHGGKDTVVPLTESQRMVDALKKAGVQDVQLTVFPDAGHDSWTEAYSNPELYQWLLQQKRSLNDR
jgi:predicted peptidase